jgi:RHS repeat-associated protein
VAATSNRLLALSNPPRSLAQDAAGNTWSDQQRKAGWTASHDLSGRLTLIRATTNSTRYTTTAYVYDTAGQRVLKQPVSQETCNGRDLGGPCSTLPIQGGGTAYIHGPNGQLLGEYNATTGAPIREYLWLQDLPLAVVAYDMATGTDPAPVFYIHTDHLNTPRVVLDRNGAQRWSWVAEPFGNSSPNTSPVGLAAFTLNLRMPGQVFDAESGLLYNWNRTYDAGVGRYTQSDPIGLEGGINTYAYAESQPTKLTDPKGLFSGALHQDVTRQAARARCPALASTLPRLVEWADYAPDSQLPSESRRHAMCVPGQSASEGMVRTERYIDEQIATCTVTGLANALHAAQDKHARGHRGCQQWDGNLTLTHVRGDLAGSGGLGDALIESQLVLDRFKAKCPCKCD